MSVISPSGNVYGRKTTAADTKTDRFASAASGTPRGRSLHGPDGIRNVGMKESEFGAWAAGYPARRRHARRLGPGVCFPAAAAVSWGTVGPGSGD
ncbi:hypothetical protein EDD92_8390 [Streptomyces sp. TLI_185]|nr:hypothetical protein EDD92_8390 [Streptomyces sp. TLI_185]